MSNNVIEQSIRPEVPDVIPNEFFYVYVPKATTTNPGIAAFNGDDFNVANGVVTIDTTKWGDKDYIDGKLVASANRIVRGSTDYAVTVDTTLKTINITSTDSETLEDGTVRSIPTTYNIPFKAGQGTTFVLNDNIIAVKSDVGVLGSGIAAEIFNNYDGGSGNQASGDRSHAEGFETSAGGFAAHAEGRGSGASGDGSHAEGWSGAVGDYSHSEGYYSSADDDYSHAEGNGSQAKGVGSHAEGYQTIAYGRYTHAEGYKTQAASNDIIIAAHAEGNETKALGYYSHAEGDNTIAIGQSQHVFGKYNVSDSNNVEIVGWGTSSERKNIRTLSPSGNEWISGKYTQEGTPTNNKDLTTKLYVDTIAASLDEDITTLKAIVGTGENYVGQLSGDALPSSSDLDDYVQEQEGRAPKGGDTIMFVLYVTGGEDEIYKYMYNGTTWASFMIPAVEVSSNGELGVVKGTYGIESDNDILVDIVDGEIKNIYAKDKDSNYVKMGLPARITETVTSVVAGTTGYDVTCEVTEERVDNTSFSYDQVRNLSIAGGTGVSLSVEDNLVKIDAEVTKSYVDSQDTTINNRITDSNIRINNLEKSVYGELADWSDETFLSLKNAVLPSTITVDDSTYNVIDGANGILFSVKGNTKQFNQLVKNGNFAVTTDTTHWVSPNTVTINYGTNECNLTFGGTQYENFRQVGNLILGHTYLYLLDFKSTNGTNLAIKLSNEGKAYAYHGFTSSECNGNWNRIAILGTLPANGTLGGFNIIIQNVNGGASSCSIRNVVLFDLTAMGLENISVSDFTALYPKEYYPYNAGTLYDSVISGVSLTGRNLWDEQWELGSLDAQGNEQSSFGTIRSKWIKVFPSTTFYTKCPTSVPGRLNVICFYDINKSFISRLTTVGEVANTTWTTPSNCYYIRFRCDDTTSYGNNIYINVSDASFNGQYAPYALRTISLPSTQTLGGVGTAQDEVQVTKNTNDDYYTIKKSVVTNNNALADIPQFNQLIRGGDFSIDWEASVSGKYSSVERLNNTLILTIETPSDTANNTNYRLRQSSGSTRVDLIGGHKYLVSMLVKTPHTVKFNFAGYAATESIENTSGAFVRYGYVFEQSSDDYTNYPLYPALLTSASGWAVGDKLEIKEFIVADITAIFGKLNEPTFSSIPYWLKKYNDYKALAAGIDYAQKHNYVYNADNDVTWTGAATETVITETATLAEVSAIRENGGMISVVGNTNEDYAQPDVSETILHSVTPNA